MKTILIFVVVMFTIDDCCGRSFPALNKFAKGPGLPFGKQLVSDEVCADDPDYHEQCKIMAQYERWCTDNKEVTHKLCAESCGVCEPTESPAPIAPTEPKPPAPAVCEDDPDYADGCPEYAAVEGYCEDQEDFMRLHCAKSCKFCEAPTEPKPPAPTVCEDDPDYADGCPEYAAVEGYCEDQEDFMRVHCAKSCKFCEAPTEPKPPAPTVPVETEEPSTEPKPPAPPVCEDDPQWASKCPEWKEDGECDDPKKERFMRKYCKKTCGFPCKPGEPSTKPKPPAPPVCEDDPQWASKCPEWKENGECDDPKKERFMRKYCKKTCGFPCKPEPTVNPETKPPSPPAFCRDRDVDCAGWKAEGTCEDPEKEQFMRIYCGVTCDFCKAPTSEDCYDRIDNCYELKEAGDCSSTVPAIEYKVKTYCLETCEFCVPDWP